MFLGLLASIVSASNHTKIMLLRIHKCMTQSTLINLLSNECSYELHYYLFVVKLNRCVGNYNTLNDLFNKVYVQNKTEDLNLSVLNAIKKNESET